MTPGQFFGNPLPFSTPEAVANAPDPTPVPTRKRVGSDVVAPDPPKRGRGRPRKETTAPSDQAKKSKPAPKPKAPKGAKSAEVQTNQENTPPTIDLADSDDDEIEKTEDGKTRHWTPEEKTRVFSFILGPDEEGDKRFEQHKVNPGHVYKKASELFNGTRSPGSVKSMYVRSLDTFVWMRAFNSFTGNGGGDADSNDPAAILKGRMKAARSAGLHLGTLKPATILEWEKKGWWDLFNDRLGTSAKVTRPVVRNSAMALSDSDNDSSGDEGSDANIDPALRKPAPTLPKTPAATVSEAKHTPSSAFQKKVNSSFGGLGEFMKLKAAAEEKKVSVLDARLALEREKLEIDKTKGKFDMAERVLGMPNVDAEVKQAANAFILSYFTS
ncbi:hypothetical protein C8R45DRAFT_1097951 [Mycena sanguinolenta]|nr:hypothetical protein C8R45DRAFT_1097951 [Mycena sanguinolenta]